MTNLTTLYEQREAAAQKIAQVRTHLAQVDAQITALVSPKALSVYDLTGKQFGKVRVEVGDGLTAEADISKKVEWDSTKLMEVAKSLPWETVQETFKIKFEVPERTYNALPDELKTMVDLARTVKYGAPKITLKRKEG